MNEARTRSPDELERDIARTRADIDRTLTILQDKLSPAAVLDRAVRSTRENGGEVAVSVGRTVRDNPVPLTLLGIGLAWLMVSNRDRPYSRDAVSPAESSPEDPSRPAGTYTSTEETTDIASSDYSPADLSSARGKGSTSGSAVRNKVSAAAASAADLRDRAQAATSDAYGKVGSKAEHLRQKVAETYEGAADKAADKADELHRRAIDAKGRTTVRAGDALNDAQGFVREHPILMGAAALAVGAGLAALFPRTQREDQLMGNKSDSLKDVARDTAIKQVDKAKRAGQAAVAEAKAEANRQDLGADDLRKELDGKAAAAKNVASAAVKAATDEAKPQSPSRPETPTTRSTSTPGASSSGAPTPPSGAPKATAPASGSSPAQSPPSSVKPGVSGSSKA